MPERKIIGLKFKVGDTMRTLEEAEEEIRDELYNSL